MKRPFGVLGLLGVLAITWAGPAFAQTDYPEVEPNDDYPATFLPGNPVFVSGDRLVGSIALHTDPNVSPTDYDVHYVTFAGAGAPGIYRYTFDLDAFGGDSFLVLFDAGPAAIPYYLGINDDKDPFVDFGSRIVFDHFDTTGANSIWGLDISALDTLGEFDYALAITRELTPVTALGVLGGGLMSLAGVNPLGAGDWYSFTLAAPGMVTLDTAGSLIDTEMALFGPDGSTIGGNDDVDFPFDTSSSIARYLAAGTYYVAVGSYTDIPELDYGGSFYNWSTTHERPLGWDRNGFSGDAWTGPYQLNIALQVPEPQGWAFLLSGLPIVAWAVRRRSRR